MFHVNSQISLTRGALSVRSEIQDQDLKMPTASYFSTGMDAHCQLRVIVYALLVTILLAATTVAALGVVIRLSQ